MIKSTLLIDGSTFHYFKDYKPNRRYVNSLNTISYFCSRNISASLTNVRDVVKAFNSYTNITSAVTGALSEVEAFQGFEKVTGN